MRGGGERPSGAAGAAESGEGAEGEGGVSPMGLQLNLPASRLAVVRSCRQAAAYHGSKCCDIEAATSPCHFPGCLRELGLSASPRVIVPQGSASPRLAQRGAELAAQTEGVWAVNFLAQWFGVWCSGYDLRDECGSIRVVSGNSSPCVNVQSVPGLPASLSGLSMWPSPSAWQSPSARCAVSAAQPVSPQSLSLLPGESPSENAEFANETPRFGDVGDIESEYVEALIWQHSPLFVVAQSAVTLSLWVGFAISSGTVIGKENLRAGLDSFNPQWSDMLIHNDCQDYRLQLWRWYTYQFTHTDLKHISVNIIMLILIGVPLEGFHGHLRMAAVFNAGVVGAALAAVTMHAHFFSLVGMSGGCYAFLGMHFADLLINWKQGRFRLTRLAVLVMLVCSDLLMAGFIFSAGQHRLRSKVAAHLASYSAHAGGFLAGLLAGVLTGRNLRVRCFDHILRVLALFLLVACISAGAARLQEWPPRSVLEQDGWCWVRQVYNVSYFGDETWHCITCHTEACIERWSAQPRIQNVDFMLCPALENGALA